MDKIVAFIMAGGKGERLYPLTKDRAKPAVPFGGPYRIIDFTLSNCINSGIRRVHILTQYKSISLARHLRLGWDIFDYTLGEYIDLIPAQQRVGETWYQGTADSIYQNIYSIEMENPDYILILSGDHIYKMDYNNLISFHKEKNVDLTIAVVEIEKEKSPQLGVVEANEYGKVLGFEEKPEIPKTIPGNPDKIFASMGVYVFTTEVLKREVMEDSKKDTVHDFGKNIIPGMVGRSNVFAYNFKKADGRPEYWRDIGTIDSYYEANMDLIQISPVFNLYDSKWPIRTYQEQAPPVKTVFAGIDDANRIGFAVDSLISNGCIISGGKVQSSVLSPHVRVNSYAEVIDSILMERVEVGRHAKVKRAIVEKDVKIFQGARIGYDLEEDRKRFTVTESKIVVVEKGTIIK